MPVLSKNRETFSWPRLESQGLVHSHMHPPGKGTPVWATVVPMATWTGPGNIPGVAVMRARFAHSHA